MLYRTFNETFSSIDSTKPWKIKLSSAGLVYVHFGKEIIEEILKKVMKQKDADKKLIEILFDKMYENFVIEIDAIDNGVEIADNKRCFLVLNGFLVLIKKFQVLGSKFSKKLEVYLKNGSY